MMFRPVHPAAYQRVASPQKTKPSEHPLVACSGSQSFVPENIVSLSKVPGTWDCSGASAIHNTV
jgi:hypothetical protein